MGQASARVARGLLIYGDELEKGHLQRDKFYENVDVKPNTFATDGAEIGAPVRTPGRRFFDTTENSVKFGPGAGLIVGVSVGSGSLRAGLVDCNGRCRFPYESELDPNQLTARPEELLERIKIAVSDVVDSAFKFDLLEDVAPGETSPLIEGKLPLVGVSVALPTGINRESRPVGDALTHPTWRGSKSLEQMIASFLDLEDEMVFVSNDTNAAATAFAFDTTRERAHSNQTHSQLTFVIRLAGGIGGATYSIEPHGSTGRSDRAEHKSLGPTPGFCKSVLFGGVNMLAGEFGHVDIFKETVEELNAVGLPDGLGELKPVRCSCSSGRGPVPNHLEAYTSIRALTRRIAPRRSPAIVLEEVLANPKTPKHDRALRDLGHLVGVSLTGPIAWLNPKTVVLTGALALPNVKQSMADAIEGRHPLVPLPKFTVLAGDENKFIRVRGAGLFVLRIHVHRRIPEILAGKRSDLASHVERIASLKSRDELPKA